MLKRYFSNAPRRCDRKASVLLQCGQGRLMFNFILTASFPPWSGGGMDQPQITIYVSKQK
jgi:hypothetical protein